MKTIVQVVVAATVAMIPLVATAQSLTEAQARAAIAPWYALFNLPVQGDMRTLQEQVLADDYESCWGYMPGECWGREASIKVVGGFAKSIPDMKFDIKEVLVSGDRVIVRGEVSAWAAMLRGAIGIEGDPQVLILFQRLTPGPSASSSRGATRARTAGR